MTTSDNFESYPPFFLPNQGVDHVTKNFPEPDPESVPEPDSIQPSDSDSGSLPVIDFEDMNPEELSEVCREWGIFRLANHGVPAELLRQLHEHAKELFRLSFEAKQGLPTSPILYFWGSPAITMSGNAKQTGPCSQKLNWLEGFHVLLSKASQLRNEDPLFESFRSLLEEYGNHQTRLAKTVFNAMAQHLNFPPTKSESYLSPPTGLLRVYRYLRCPMAEQRWGISAHTDSSVLSILHQDQVGGLQVYKDNKWLDVKPQVQDISFILEPPWRNPEFSLLFDSMGSLESIVSKKTSRRVGGGTFSSSWRQRVFFRVQRDNIHRGNLILYPSRKSDSHPFYRVYVRVKLQFKISRVIGAQGEEIEKA